VRCGDEEERFPQRDRLDSTIGLTLSRRQMCWQTGRAIPLGFGTMPSKGTSEP
jgi:hypothetical protein